MTRFAFITSLAFALSHAEAADSVVVFNEINYHPAANESGNEWIELHNQMAIDIDLSAWHLEDGVNFTFAEGTVISAGGYLVIASDPPALKSATGLTTVLGPFAGSLGNSGEQIELRDRNDRLMDRIKYADGGKWPSAPDGSGATLAKRDPDSTSNEPDHWASSVVIGGTPGWGNFPESATAQAHSLVALNALWRYEASGTDLGTSWKDAAFNDSSWAGQNGATLLSYWPFNGDATATVGVNGALVGGVTATTDRNGTAGGALAFVGSASQFVSVPGGGGLDASPAGTISLWAKWSGTQDADCCGSFGAILARQGDGLFSDNILALNTSNPASARIVWKQSGGPAPTLLTGTTAVGTAWHHIAVTFSPTASTLYVDGIAQATATGPALHAGPSVPLSIGAWAAGGGGFMTGSLDDGAIWKELLTPGQIAQLAASTKSPSDFSGSEIAVYFSGDGRLTANDDLRKTALPVGPTTYYFRKSFNLAGAAALTELNLDLAIDDGAVFYLNGAEVYRHNMPGGAVSYSTLAASTVGDAPLLAGIALPANNLVPGTNVLAVEVHQAMAGDPGMVFGAGLNAEPLPDDLVFNEMSAGAPGFFQLELYNRGASVLDVAGFVIKRTGVSPDAEVTLPSQMLASGGFLVLDQAALGFTAAPGDKVFLFRPGRAAVADAVEVHERPRARSPDGTGEFLTPNAATFGATNTFTWHEEIVFNEIMYHAPPTLEFPAVAPNPAIPYSTSPEEWVELLNRSNQPVNLTGWRLDGGIDFRFAPNTMIGPGGYLVVAKDPAALQVKFPGLAALGPFDNKLSHTGEQIVLRDADDNPADSVHYFDDGRWPEAADAGGSSLELRDPRADNSAGESWSASDESDRSAWQTYSYTGAAAASPVGPDTGPGSWKEFVIGLLDKGEVLLDDISVIEAPTTAPIEMLQNGSFTTDARDMPASTWRIIGNHHGTVIEDPDQPGNNVLRLVATGSTDHMSNHAETTFVGSRSVVNGRVYRISFRAKWISGCRQLNTRLYFNRLAHTTILDGHSRYGTPGTANTAVTANIGPTFEALRHEPVVPALLAPITVSVMARDPDGVSAMTLWSRPDAGAWASQPMTIDPAAPARFSAVLPGRAAGTVVQFYVEATDGLGATSTFPAAGAGSRVLYKVNDGLAKANGLHNVRLITLAADATELHKQINLMSNERIGCTMIYDEREVFYDIGLRLKGSEHSRTENLRLGFNLGFDSAHLFRGIHRSVAIDRSESTGFGQREMLIHQMLNHAGGVPTKYHDLIQVMAPLAIHTGTAELQLARYTDVFLDDQFENGGDGMVFEYELIYELLSTDGGLEGNKLPAPDNVAGTSIRNLGEDKEGYRWNFLIKNNEDRDDYSHLMPWAKWMATTGTNFTNQLTTYLDVDQWLRGTAVNVLSGMGDSYGGDGSQHNVQFYVRPSDGRILFFPHDMDAFFDANRLISVGSTISPNGDFSKIIALPGYQRDYYCHLLDIIKTSLNSAYLGRWATQFGQLTGQPFASHLTAHVQRATAVTTQIKSLIPVTTPFAITTNGGLDQTTTENTFTLTGTAPLIMGTTVPLVVVKRIMINGVLYPITWTSKTAWSITVPLFNGANAFTVQGVDPYGVPVATALDTITITTTGPGSLLPVKINEWMADNAGPGGLADPADGAFQDWIELFNPNSTEVNLSGFTLTDNLSQPTKWPIPAGTLIAPHAFLLVWADNQTAQNAPGADLHAGFQLSSDGEDIGLFNPAGVAQHTVSFGVQTENVSQGLFPDGDITLLHSMNNWTPRAPNTLASPLRFTDISLAGGAVTLTWDAIPGRTYRAEFKNSLADPAWSPLVPDVIAPSTTASATDSVGLPPLRFYRVRRLD